jgi:glycosyltransferase involved in cell wall biosynthesis
VLRQENRGISAAMNAGLRAARGEYIARLDSDDVWLADLLTCETAVLDAQSAVGVVYAKAQAMSADGVPRAHFVGLPLYYPHDSLLSLLWGDATCNIALLARRSCFEVTGFYDETLRTHEDWDMWLRVARRYRFVFLDRVLARFREHEQSITSPSLPTFVGHIESRVKVLDKLYSSTNLSSQVLAFKPIAYRNVYTEIGVFLFNTGHRARALRMFQRAITSGGNPLLAFVRILWLTIAVRRLTHFRLGRMLLQLQARVRRQFRMLMLADAADAADRQPSLH